MNIREKIVSAKEIYSGKVVKLELADVELPDGKPAKREIIRHKEAVAILAVDDDKNVYLVEQYRAPIDDTILEIPAGHVEAGENPEETAVRELQEEIGMSCKKIKLINKYYTSCGFTDELIYFYLAEDLYEKKSKEDEDEFINVKKIPFDELLDLVKNQKLTDVKAILATYFYRAETINK